MQLGNRFLEQAGSGKCGFGRRHGWEGDGGDFFWGDGVGLLFGAKDAVAIKDLLAGDCGGKVAGDDDAGEVHQK